MNVLQYENSPTNLDLRLAAFKWLADRSRLNDGIFDGTELARGFEHEGRRITLKGPTGIWFPAGFSMPLSITSRYQGPYPLDSIGRDGILTYAYRGTDPNHRDNRGLRAAMHARAPLIFFQEIYNHRYMAVWPIIIISDNPERLCVQAVREPAYDQARNFNIDEIESPLDVRRYATVQARARLHQTAFREQVLHAYHEQCAMCRLAHPELLDAAHIIPDSEEEGLPLISNGLSLCKIHHAAFDKNIIGVDPDYRIHLREDILHEHDGPMLRYGLQELNHARIRLPSRQEHYPDRERLEARFRIFQTA
ncbi:MAG: HNH endonuclease [Rectinema sp.]|nr:HNH endonuclease [Rectinema sp.]